MFSCCGWIYFGLESFNWIFWNQFFSNKSHNVSPIRIFKIGLWCFRNFKCCKRKIQKLLSIIRSLKKSCTEKWGHGKTVHVQYPLRNSTSLRPQSKIQWLTFEESCVFSYPNRLCYTISRMVFYVPHSTMSQARIRDLQAKWTELRNVSVDRQWGLQWGITAKFKPFKKSSKVKTKI